MKFDFFSSELIEFSELLLFRWILQFGKIMIFLNLWLWSWHVLKSEYIFSSLVLICMMHFQDHVFACSIFLNWLCPIYLGNYFI